MRGSLTSEQVGRAARLPVANIGDAMHRLNVCDHGIKPVWSGARIAGRARTVQTAAGDNQGIHAILPTLDPGEILVVDGQGLPDRALIGELIAGRARAVGAGGFLICGAVRDVQDLEDMGFPVFARGVSPAGPYRNGPFNLDVPVAIGGVVVQPGDLVVGDGDGVAIIPAGEVDAVLERAERKHADETVQREDIEAQWALLADVPGEAGSQGVLEKEGQS